MTEKMANRAEKMRRMSIQLSGYFGSAGCCPISGSILNSKEKFSWSPGQSGRGCPASGRSQPGL